MIDRRIDAIYGMMSARLGSQQRIYGKLAASTGPIGGSIFTLHYLRFTEFGGVVVRTGTGMSSGFSSFALPGNAPFLMPSNTTGTVVEICNSAIPDDTPIVFDPSGGLSVTTETSHQYPPSSVPPSTNVLDNTRIETFEVTWPAVQRRTEGDWSPWDVEFSVRKKIIQSGVTTYGSVTLDDLSLSPTEILHHYEDLMDYIADIAISASPGSEGWYTITLTIDPYDWIGHVYVRVGSGSMQVASTVTFLLPEEMYVTPEVYSSFIFDKAESENQCAEDAYGEDEEADCQAAAIANYPTTVAEAEAIAALKSDWEFYRLTEGRIKCTYQIGGYSQYVMKWRNDPVEETYFYWINNAYLQSLPSRFRIRGDVSDVPWVGATPYFYKDGVKTYFTSFNPATKEAIYAEDVAAWAAGHGSAVPLVGSWYKWSETGPDEEGWRRWWYIKTPTGVWNQHWITQWLDVPTWAMDGSNYKSTHYLYWE